MRLRIPKPSVLGKPTPFSNSPEMRSFQTKQSVNKTNVSDGLFKPVTPQEFAQNRNNRIRSNLSTVPSSSNSLADCTTHPIHCPVPQSSKEVLIIADQLPGLSWQHDF
ncbi:hypothetical protein Tco_1165014 [Tanacetum coccineum]